MFNMQLLARMILIDAAIVYSFIYGLFAIVASMAAGVVFNIPQNMFLFKKVSGFLNKIKNRDSISFSNRISFTTLATVVWAINNLFVLVLNPFANGKVANNETCKTIVFNNNFQAYLAKAVLVRISTISKAKRGTS